MCAECHKALSELKEVNTEINQRLASLVATNQALLLHQRTLIPKFLSQARLYLGNVSTLQMRLQSQQVANVTSILIQAPSNWTLTINERSWTGTAFTVIPIGYLNGLIVKPEDLIQLTTTVAANVLGLEFFGEELPDKGQRW